MYHIINSIVMALSNHMTLATDDPILVNLDVRNAFNTESRQCIYDLLAAGCSAPSLPGTNPDMWRGWDIL